MKDVQRKRGGLYIESLGRELLYRSCKAGTGPERTSDTVLNHKRR